MKPILLFFILLIINQSFAELIPTKREMQMVDEINLVRTQPKEYIPVIHEYLEYWDSGKSERDAADELIKVLETMEALDPLEFSEELYAAAYKHGQWMKKHNRFQHSDLPYGENMCAGDDLPKMAMASLLIDDGIKSRGHRWNILNPDYTKVACREVPGAVSGMNYVYIQIFD